MTSIFTASLGACLHATSESARFHIASQLRERVAATAAAADISDDTPACIRISKFSLTEDTFAENPPVVELVGAPELEAALALNNGNARASMLDGKPDVRTFLAKLWRTENVLFIFYTLTAQDAEKMQTQEAQEAPKKVGSMTCGFAAPINHLIKLLTDATFRVAYQAQHSTQYAAFVTAKHDAAFVAAWKRAVQDDAPCVVLMHKASPKFGVRLVPLATFLDWLWEQMSDKDVARAEAIERSVWERGGVRCYVNHSSQAAYAISRARLWEAIHDAEQDL